MRLERTVLGYPLIAELTALDEGWDVSITGGSRTYVGAVTLAEPDVTIQTLQREQHRDGRISEQWASELAKHLHSPVCVRCGIHYDAITKEQLAAVIDGCNALLFELTEILKAEWMKTCNKEGTVRRLC